MATDPDADRVGFAVRDDKGELVLLNGNQIFSYSQVTSHRRWSELLEICGGEYVVKTIVTTEFVRAIL